MAQVHFFFFWQHLEADWCPIDHMLHIHYNFAFLFVHAVFLCFGLFCANYIYCSFPGSWSPSVAITEVSSIFSPIKCIFLGNYSLL